MYNYFKNRQSLIRTGICLGVALLVAIIMPIVNFATDMEYNEAIPNDCLGLVYVLLAWAYGNHIINQYYRDNHNYGQKLPLEIKRQVKQFRYPLYMAGLLSILIGETIHLIYIICR